MNEYELLKQEIAMKSVEFKNTDNLFLLVDIYIAANKILQTNNFPIGKYKKWKKEK